MGDIKAADVSDEPEAYSNKEVARPIPLQICRLKLLDNPVPPAAVLEVVDDWLLVALIPITSNAKNRHILEVSDSFSTGRVAPSFSNTFFAVAWAAQTLAHITR